MTDSNQDPNLWSELTGLPITHVEVVPGGQPVEGSTIDGQQLVYGDSYHLTIDGAEDTPNGAYIVTGSADDDD